MGASVNQSVAGACVSQCAAVTESTTATHRHCSTGDKLHLCMWINFVSTATVLMSAPVSHCVTNKAGLWPCDGKHTDGFQRWVFVVIRDCTETVYHTLPVALQTPGIPSWSRIGRFVRGIISVCHRRSLPPGGETTIIPCVSGYPCIQPVASNGCHYHLWWSQFWWEIGIISNNPKF